MKYLLFLSILLSIIHTELISPINLDTLSKIHVLFEWEQEPYALDYNIQVSKTSMFDDTVIDTNSYSLVYIDKENLNWDNEYYWRVRPIFLNGIIGPWIDENSFSIFNEVLISDIEYSEVDANNNNLIIFGDSYREKSIVFDRNGQEIWNAGSDFSINELNDYG